MRTPRWRADHVIGIAKLEDADQDLGRIHHDSYRGLMGIAVQLGDHGSQHHSQRIAEVCLGVKQGPLDDSIRKANPVSAGHAE